MGGRTVASGLPVVAVVGRPNVGKSSLVNRILRKREAIVEETPGVTRDRRGFIADWAGRTFEIFDTGGLEPGADGLDARVADQAQVAITAADVVVLVVDAASGPMQDDHVVADVLRRAGKPVILAANKVDDPRDIPGAAAFHRLGLGEPLPLSALHGRGSGDFLDALVEALPETGREADDDWASVAIVGRPNVGKSSLLNALVGESRAIVDSVPGTTRDPVDSHVVIGEGQKARIVDTAGMRREVQINDPLEYFSFLRSRQTLARVDAALLVIDASEKVTGHDQRIAQEIVDHGRACVVVLNKWDLVDTEPTDLARLERFILERLRFIPWATMVRTSALGGRGVQKIWPAVTDAVGSHRRRLSTSVVNRLIRDAQERKPHPRVGGRARRILYAVQAAVSPPRVVLFASAALEPGYVRYIEHRLRAHEPFAGSPLEIEVRIKTRHPREG